MNLDKIKTIYMIGIKGVGMTMLAQYLHKKGYTVSGSDVDETFMTDGVLGDSKIKFFNGFDVKNIPEKVDLLVYSTAYNEKTNEEVALALKTKKVVLTYAEALGEFFKKQHGIAVAGSHGKTTTTAWLGFVLDRCGMSPSVMVGANVPQFKGSSLNGSSDTLIIEADEYQNKLKYFEPKAVLLNNIDYDHPDFFPTKDDYNKVFIEFIKKIPKKGFLVANFDDKVIKKYAYANSRARVISYSLEGEADYLAYDIKQVATKQFFKVKMASQDFFDEGESPDDGMLGDFIISLSGRHNVYNALAVIASSIELGAELHEIRKYLEEFTGTARRMEVLGEFRGATIIDDYAHHPAEIKTTLEGARKVYLDKRIRVIFHPHTFTRTKGFLEDFGKCFGCADEVIIMDIYSSAREEQGGVHSTDLLEKISQNKKDKQQVKYIPTLKKVEEYLRDTTKSGEVIILMGAGDVFRVGHNLLA